MAVPNSELDVLQASALETPGRKREKGEKWHQEERAEIFSKVCVCVRVCGYCLRGSCAESFAAPRLSLFLSLLALHLIAIIAGL